MATHVSSLLVDSCLEYLPARVQRKRPTIKARRWLLAKCAHGLLEHNTYVGRPVCECMRVQGFANTKLFLRACRCAQL